MSHIIQAGVVYKSLDCLGTAAKRLGAELRIGQTTHRYYANGQGRCDHAIILPNDRAAYEVGVVQQADGTYKLMFDDFGGWNVFGEGFSKLTLEYQNAVAEQRLQELCWTYDKNPDGSILVYHPEGGTITLAPGGIIEAHGFIGSSCEEATRAIAQALGNEISSEHKAEYYQTRIQEMES